MIGIATSAARKDVTIDNVYIDNIANFASAIEVGGEEFSIRDCKIDSDGAAIKDRHSGLTNSVISNNIHDSQAGGAFVEMSYCRRLTITGNVTDSPYNGIVLKGASEEVTIDGNVIYRPQAYGILVEDAARLIVVSDNVIDLIAGDGGSTCGILFDNTAATGYSRWNEINGNVVNYGEKGIGLINASNIQIVGNTVASCSVTLDATYTSGYGSPDHISITGNEFNDGGWVEIDGTNITSEMKSLLYANNIHKELDEVRIETNIYGALVAGNVFDYTSLRLEDADGSMISGNNFTDGVGFPFPFTETGVITVVASDDVTVEGNTISGTPVLGTIAAIELSGTMTRARIISNKYSNNAPGGSGAFANGITIGASVSSTTLHGNDFSLATTAINDSGTGTSDLHDSPLTTKGDLFGFDTADARIPVGSNDQVLTADSAQALGVKWATPDTVRAFHTYAITGDFAVGTGTLRVPITVAQTITNIRAMCDEAPTTTDVIFDVNKNGTTIYPTTTKPTITAGTNDSSNSTPDTTALAAGDYLTIDVDQVGTGTVGADGTLIIEVSIP